MQFDGKLPCEVICLPLFSVLSKSGQVRNFDKCKFFCVPCVSRATLHLRSMHSKTTGVKYWRVKFILREIESVLQFFFAEMLLHSFILSSKDGENYSNFHAAYTILYK